MDRKNSELAGYFEIRLDEVERRGRGRQDDKNPDEAFHSHNDSLTADKKRSQGARGFSEGSPEKNNDESRKKGGSPSLVPGDQKSAEAQENKADEPYGVS